MYESQEPEEFNSTLSKFDPHKNKRGKEGASVSSLTAKMNGAKWLLDNGHKLSVTITVTHVDRKDWEQSVPVGEQDSSTIGSLLHHSEPLYQGNWDKAVQTLTKDYTDLRTRMNEFERQKKTHEREQKELEFLSVKHPKVICVCSYFTLQSERVCMLTLLYNPSVCAYFTIRACVCLLYFTI
jgi:hypothetical protein